MRGLSDKVILVAGGATGIGASTVQRLVEEGASVVLGDINVRSAEATAGMLRATGGNVAVVEYDQADESSIAALVQQASSAFGGLDGIFCNAADLSAGVIRADTDVVDMDIAVWRRTIDVDLTGYFLITRHALPHLLSRGRGSIVYTSSAASFTGDGGVRPAYGAAKAGVNALARHVAVRWGKQGIRANAVAPGPTEIEVAPEDEAHRTYPEELRQGYLARMLSPRLGRGSDLAGMVTFLLSDDGEQMTGQVISVDGGMTTR